MFVSINLSHNHRLNVTRSWPQKTHATVFRRRRSKAWLSLSFVFWVDKMPHLVKLYFLDCAVDCRFFGQQTSCANPPRDQWTISSKSLSEHVIRTLVKRVEHDTQCIEGMIFSLVLSSPSTKLRPQSLHLYRCFPRIFPLLIVVWDKWQFLHSGIGTPTILGFDVIITRHYLKVNALKISYQ
jgi:hypothetical protein